MHQSKHNHYNGIFEKKIYEHKYKKYKNKYKQLNNDNHMKYFYNKYGGVIPKNIVDNIHQSNNTDFCTLYMYDEKLVKYIELIKNNQNNIILLDEYYSETTNLEKIKNIQENLVPLVDNYPNVNYFDINTAIHVSESRILPCDLLLLENKYKVIGNIVKFLDEIKLISNINIDHNNINDIRDMFTSHFRLNQGGNCIGITNKWTMIIQFMCINRIKEFLEILYIIHDDLKYRRIILNINDITDKQYDDIIILILEKLYDCKSANNGQTVNTYKGYDVTRLINIEDHFKFQKEFEDRQTITQSIITNAMAQSINIYDNVLKYIGPIITNIRKYIKFIKNVDAFNYFKYCFGCSISELFFMSFIGYRLFKNSYVWHNHHKLYPINSYAIYLNINPIKYEHNDSTLLIYNTPLTSLGSFDAPDKMVTLQFPETKITDYGSSCVENTIFKIIRFFLLDPITNSYNINRLITLNIHKDFLIFIQDNIDKLVDDSVFDKMYIMLCNLPGIEYRSTYNNYNYVVKSKMQNVKNILEYIFVGLNKLKDIHIHVIYDEKNYDLNKLPLLNQITFEIKSGNYILVVSMDNLHTFAQLKEPLSKEYIDENYKFYSLIHAFDYNSQAMYNIIQHSNLQLIKHHEFSDIINIMNLNSILKNITDTTIIKPLIYTFMKDANTPNIFYINNVYYTIFDNPSTNMNHFVLLNTTHNIISSSYNQLIDIFMPSNIFYKNTIINHNYHDNYEHIYIDKNTVNCPFTVEHVIFIYSMFYLYNGDNKIYVFLEGIQKYVPNKWYTIIQYLKIGHLIYNFLHMYNDIDMFNILINMNMTDLIDISKIDMLDDITDPSIKYNYQSGQSLLPLYEYMKSHNEYISEKQNILSVFNNNKFYNDFLHVANDKNELIYKIVLAVLIRQSELGIISSNSNKLSEEIIKIFNSVHIS